MKQPPSAWLLGLAAVAALLGCRRSDESRQAPAASIERPQKETEIGKVRLREDAEKKLSVATARVEKKRIARARTYGGEAVVPSGGSVLVAAPVSGFLTTARPEPLRSGDRVERGQDLYTLTMTSADHAALTANKASVASARADAEADVAKAKVQFELARIALDRAEKMLGEQIGSTQQVDQARADFGVAKASLAGSEARRDALARASKQEAGGAPMTIEAPISGVIHRVSAIGGAVPAGAPLLEIVRPDPMWIRVPVFVGELAGIDLEADALVKEGLDSTAPPKKAKPIVTSPSASLSTATVDLYYGLDNADSSLRPGQATDVELVLRSEGEALVAPWASILHDIHGGDWVYERIEPHVYLRRRVHVHHVVGATAVLADASLRPGAELVTDGATELFGMEFGVVR